MTKTVTCGTSSTSYGSSGHVMSSPPNHNSNNTIISGGNTSSNNGSNGPFKPVPPPKPKNYRPPLQNSSNSNNAILKSPQTWEYTVSTFIIAHTLCLAHLYFVIIYTLNHRKPAPHVHLVVFITQLQLCITITPNRIQVIILKEIAVLFHHRHMEVTKLAMLEDLLFHPICHQLIIA